MQEKCLVVVAATSEKEYGVRKRRTVNRCVKIVGSHAIYKSVEIGEIKLFGDKVAVYRSLKYKSDHWTAFLESIQGLYDDLGNEPGNSSQGSPCESAQQEEKRQIDPPIDHQASRCAKMGCKGLAYRGNGLGLQSVVGEVEVYLCQDCFRHASQANMARQQVEALKNKAITFTFTENEYNLIRYLLRYDRGNIIDIHDAIPDKRGCYTIMEEYRQRYEFYLERGYVRYNVLSSYFADLLEERAKRR